MNRRTILIAAVLVLSVVITYAVAAPGSPNKPEIKPGLNTPKINLRPNVYGQKLDASNIQLTQITQQVMSKKELIDKRASLEKAVVDLQAEIANINNLIAALD